MTHSTLIVNCISSLAKSPEQYCKAHLIIICRKVRYINVKIYHLPLHDTSDDHRSMFLPQAHKYGDGDRR